MGAATSATQKLAKVPHNLIDHGFLAPKVMYALARAHPVTDTLISIVEHHNAKNLATLFGLFIAFP